VNGTEQRSISAAWDAIEKIRGEAPLPDNPPHRLSAWRELIVNPLIWMAAVGVVVTAVAWLLYKPGSSTESNHESNKAGNGAEQSAGLPLNGWIVGDRGIILHTQDDGRTWQRQTSGTDKDLTSVSFASATSGWTFEWYGNVLHTTDGGAHWYPQDSGAKELVNIDFVTSSLGWALGWSQEKNVPSLFFTGDGGVSWTQQAIQSHVNLNGLFLRIRIGAGCADLTASFSTPKMED
jgi:photosystem II stability/assembly factor-like uncharacterized protein